MSKSHCRNYIWLKVQQIPKNGHFKVSEKKSPRTTNHYNIKKGTLRSHRTSCSCQTFRKAPLNNQYLDNAKC